MNGLRYDRDRAEPVRPMEPTLIDFYVAQIAEYWRDPVAHWLRILPAPRVRQPSKAMPREERLRRQREISKALRLRRKQ